MQLADVARKHCGTKWKHIGRNQYGLDCAGLVLLSCQELGYPFLDVDEPYPRRPSGYNFVRQVARWFVPGDPTNVVENDVVLFKENTFPCHIGIIGRLNGELSLIHAHAKVGKVVEEYFDLVWRPRMTHVFKLPER